MEVEYGKLKADFRCSVCGEVKQYSAWLLEKEIVPAYDSGIGPVLMGNFTSGGSLRCVLLIVNPAVIKDMSFEHLIVCRSCVDHINNTINEISSRSHS